MRLTVRWALSKPYDHLCKVIRQLSRFRNITPRRRLGNALAYAANQLADGIMLYGGHERSSASL